MRYLPALLATLCTVPALAEIVKIEVVDHKFVPETSKAKEGDILEFHFKEGNHSVAMSELQSKTGPCVPAEKGGFFSGYIDAEDGESDEVFRVTVNDTDPIVFYSTQGEECNWGMIGGVNINDPEVFQDYREYALEINGNVAPREPFGGVVVSADGKDKSDTDKNDKDAESQDEEGGAAGFATAGLVSVIGFAAFVAGIV